jgi:HD superfamily phosphohydrolase YqeK
MTDARLAHVERVAELVVQWAEALGVPDNERNRWLKAVWLHDAMRDAPAEELKHWAPSADGPIELRHGPAAAARAKAEGETDRGVLDAVRYHSVGLTEWDMVGRMLYCADFVEPGRPFDQDKHRDLADRLPRDVGGVLREVLQLRVTHMVRSHWPLPDPRVRFWNSVCATHDSD